MFFAEEPQLWPPVVTRTWTAPSTMLDEFDVAGEFAQTRAHPVDGFTDARFEILGMQGVEQQQAAGDGVIAELVNDRAARSLRFQRRSPSCVRGPLRARPSEAARAPCTRVFCGPSGIWSNCVISFPSCRTCSWNSVPVATSLLFRVVRRSRILVGTKLATIRVRLLTPDKSRL